MCQGDPASRTCQRSASSNALQRLWPTACVQVTVEELKAQLTALQAKGEERREKKNNEKCVCLPNSHFITLASISVGPGGQHGSRCAGQNSWSTLSS